ncbi:MAG: CPBP family intramembrane glutamic endopeptidase [Cyanobacteria bacterium P01_F01_bin.3]
MAKQSPKHPEMEPLSRAELLVAMAATAMILLLIARIWQFFEPLRLPVILQWQAAGLGLLLGLSISAGSALVYRLWPAYRKSADIYLSFVLTPLLISDCIWIGLLPGMSEELLFRGVMLPAFGLNPTGVLLSSLCFGVMHVSRPHQWPYGIWASGVGILLGMSAMTTGNLLVPIVAHVVTNAISSLFWQMNRREQVG